jgi:ComEC/Rec2-related protein
VQRLKLGALLNFFLFISFSSGIILGKFFPHFYFFLSAALIFFFASCYFFFRKSIILSDIFILALFLALGALWHIPSSCQGIDNFLDRKGEVTLQVISLPQDKTRFNTFTGRLRQIDGYRVNHKIKVIDYTKGMDYLNLYRLRAKIIKRVYKKRPFYYLWTKKDTKIQQLPPGAFSRIAQRLTRYVLYVFRTYCSPQAYRFLSSVFLGRRELLADIRELFVDAGVAHLLAISGLHLGFTSLIVFFILRFFHLRFRMSLLISLVFLYFYTFLTGAHPSTLRAVVMFSVFAAGFFLKRKIKVFNSLSLAGFAILIFEPSALFNVGFQLSFLSVFAIIAGFGIFRLKQPGNPVYRYLKNIFFCSLFVSVGISPLISYYFGKIYLASILYNIVLIPAFTFILVVNLLLLILSPFSFAAQSLGAALSLSVSFFIRLVAALGSLPYSFIPYTFSPLAMGVYYFLLGVTLTVLIFRQKNAPVGQRL